MSNFDFDRRVIDLAVRFDLATFIHKTFQTIGPGEKFHMNWHIQAMAYHLKQCVIGKIKLLLITMPPRHLKSISASVACSAWILGLNPSARIICPSHSDILAIKHSLTCRAVMETDWYRRIFPHTRISKEKNTEEYFMTTRGGFRYATPVGGSLAGHGANFIIIDDPLNPEQAYSEAKRSSVNEWFDRTVYSRLDDKERDVIIVVMQRLHVDDLAGYLLQKGGWVHLNLPAIAEVEQRIPIGPDQTYVRRPGEILHEAREPRAILDRIRANMGSFNFAAQWQQNPIPPEGEVIIWNWFRFYDQPPRRERGDTIVQSWDTASKPGDFNDWSVCTTWHIKGNDYSLIDVLRERLKYPELKRRIIDHSARFGANSIIIEDTGSGTSLIQDLDRERVVGLPKPIALRPEGDKVTRMHAQSAKIEAGHVYLPRRAGWLEEFRDELLQFPRGRHDDQVDSLSQFLNWIDRRQR